MSQTKVQGRVETLFAVDRIRSFYSIKTTTVLYLTTIEAVPVGCRGLAPESEFTFSEGIFAKKQWSRCDRSWLIALIVGTRF
jgi:hypothetical protein